MATPIKNALKQIFIKGFTHTEENRATLDLAAIVHAKARPYVDSPECKKQFSMRLELVRISN